MPTPRNPRLWTALAVLTALVGAVAAAAKLLTHFESFDDEGYMLVSLAHYVRHGHLYTQTFSQYGPFFFYAQGIFFQLLHLPVTHEMGRLVTLVYWVASSLLAAVFAYRLSKSSVMACAAGLCVMAAGSALANEPGHPQQLVLLLYTAAACLCLPSRSGHGDPHFVLLGCVGAALAFTKVNVGVFYIAGLAHALVCLLPSGKLRSIGLALTLSYAAAIPWLLMHGGFSRGARGYWLLATVTGLATFACAARIRPRGSLPVRAALLSGAGLLVGAALIVCATSLQGMPLHALVFGVIRNPLNQPDLFYILLYISRLNLLAGMAAVAVLMALAFNARFLAAPRSLGALRLAAGIGAVVALALGSQIQWVAPLLLLTLMPRANEDRGAAALFPRLFITCMAVTQFLEPYPVAGSQRAIAAAPMILWAFLCISDGVDGLRTSAPAPSRRWLPGAAMEAAIGGAILVVVAGASIMASPLRAPLPPPSTGLKGSEWLHLPADRAALYASIARAVSENCDMLFTMPGMGSFNVWSGLPTPDGWNMTGWTRGIGVERQADTLRIIQSDPRACAILSRHLVRMWDQDAARIATLPLARYVTIEMPKAAQFGEYEIRVHPRRAAPWL